jgi:uncharacterized protein YjbI with pentapeptide repeats
MAKEEHLDILKQGVEIWNQWRMKHPEIKPDFIRSDLPHANLSQANLSEANFYNSNLGDADMSGANLTQAYLGSACHLSGVNFSHANLLQASLSMSFLDNADFNHANLSHADLSGSILENANFSSAHLYRTDFYDADLSGAHFRGARFSRTLLSNVDLSKVLGLDSCSHDGPSIIDHHTLLLSGRLPLNFLRGCGLPDTFIAHIPSLFGDHSVQFYSCFISYSNRDSAFARKLHADLQNNGVRCWFAPQDLKIGDRIRYRIDDSIRVYDKLLLILSENSVSSQWVEQEVETALAKEREQGQIVLFPITLDNTVMNIGSGWPALIKNARHIGDFRDWNNHKMYQTNFSRLLRDLKAENLKKDNA